MRIGDVAVLSREAIRDGHILHCGTGTYTHAIVGRVEPFALVSDDGSMMWTATVKPEQFYFLCRACDEVVETVARRIRNEGGAP